MKSSVGIKSLLLITSLMLLGFSECEQKRSDENTYLLWKDRCVTGEIIIGVGKNKGKIEEVGCTASDSRLLNEANKCVKDECHEGWFHPNGYSKDLIVPEGYTKAYVFEGFNPYGQFPTDGWVFLFIGKPGKAPILHIYLASDTEDNSNRTGEEMFYLERSYKSNHGQGWLITGESWWFIKPK